MKHLFSAVLRRTLLVTLIVSVVAAGLPVRTAHAAYAPDFQAGNIIGDTLFFDGGTMSQDQIQQFLNAQVPNCDTNGTQTSEYGGGTRAQYGASRGYPAPYICLKNYYENPNTLANNLNGVMPSGGWSAAQIISNAAITYNISPKALLVTLQKETSLVTDTWPFPNQYRKATGYGCPDGGVPCDAQYYGFYNQVTNAARQFRLYATKPSNYRYKAGQNNVIQYNPEISCGSSTVYVQNQATAGLYNYTPYQPNAAALNNLYGLGNDCSAYGNRNFWRLYTDWFGSTAGSDLVRTVDNATVYLISGSKKYPIADPNLLTDFSALGKQVLFVSNDFINNHTTGPLLTHMIGANGGTLYFVTSAIKLPFTSCGQVSDYGYDCGSVNYLTDAQLNLLVSGPALTPLYKTTSGRLFYIKSGVKREVFDQQSLAAANISGTPNTLLDGGIAYLQYGQPVIREGVVVNSRSGGSFLYTNSAFLPLNNELANLSYITSLPKGALDDSSIPGGQRGPALTGFVTDTVGTNKYALLAGGKVQLTDPDNWVSSYGALNPTLLSSLPTASDPLNNGLVKTANDGTVYYVLGGKKRPIPTWVDLVNLQAEPFVINTLGTTEFNTLPTGRLIYAPGTMVKTSTSATVYVVKSDTELLPITSFLFPQELGLVSVLETMSTADFSNYTVGSALQTRISCSGQNYVGIGGKIYPMDAAALTQFGFEQSDFVEVGSLCNLLPKSTQPVPSFLITSNGTIYMVQSGAKHALTGYGAYVAHGGTPQNTVRVSDHFAGLIPKGSDISQ